MSQGSPKAGRQGRAKTSSTKDTVIRVVVWGAVAVLVALAIWEFRTKRNAETTAQTWADAEELRSSQLDETVAGSPVVGDEEPAKPISEGDDVPGFAEKMVRYRWKGVFRDYTVVVYLGRGEDAEVEAVRGPYTRTLE